MTYVHYSCHSLLQRQFDKFDRKTKQMQSKMAFGIGILRHLITVQAVHETQMKENHFLFTGQQHSSFGWDSREATDFSVEVKNTTFGGRGGVEKL